MLLFRQYGSSVALLCALAGFLPAAAIVGCKGAGRGDGASLSPEERLLPPTPEFATLAALQNERIGKITDFWSRASLRAVWVDDEGERHREEGEGHLILRLPYQTSLTVGKVGEIGYWAGSDMEHFWLFDSVDRDNPIAFLARNENAFSPCAEPLPLAIHPLEVVDLMGFSTLPEVLPITLADGTVQPAPATPEVVVDDLDRSFVVTLPGPFSVRRIAFDADHPDLVPKRVELLDPNGGRVLAIAELTEYVRLDVIGLGPGLQPWVPSRLYIRPGGADVDPEENFVRLTLAAPADRPTSRREIDPRVFEFRTVQRQMRPDRIEVLDQNCPEPAEVSAVAGG